MNGQYFETELKIKDRNSFEPQTGYFELSSSQRLTTFVLPMIICFSAIMARFSSNIVQDFDFSIGQNLSSGYIALKSPHFLNFRSFMLSVLHMRSISSWMDSSLNDRNVGDFSARVNMLSSTSCFPGKLRTLTASWSSSQRPRSGIWGQARLSTLRLSHAKTVPPCLQKTETVPAHVQTISSPLPVEEGGGGGQPQHLGPGRLRGLVPVRVDKPGPELTRGEMLGQVEISKSNIFIIK